MANVVAGSLGVHCDRGLWPASSARLFECVQCAMHTTELPLQQQSQLSQGQQTATGLNQPALSSRQPSNDDTSRKPRNWKLIVDPCLLNSASSAGQSKNAQQKVYRTEGVVAGVSTRRHFVPQIDSLHHLYL